MTIPHIEEPAHWPNAKVVFWQVVEPVPVIPSPEETHPAFDPLELKRPKRAADTYLAALRGEFHEKVRKSVAHGSIAEVIKNVAEREDADLIAAAVSGRGALARMLYGSVAEGFCSEWTVVCEPSARGAIGELTRNARIQTFIMEALFDDRRE